jgi:hypothetical protein
MDCRRWFELNLNTTALPAFVFVDFLGVENTFCFGDLYFEEYVDTRDE